MDDDDDYVDETEEPVAQEETPASSPEPVPPPVERATYVPTETKPPVDDWEPYKPPAAAAAPADDWEPYQPPAESRGFAERMSTGWKGGFGEEPLGLSPENQRKMPMLQGFQPLLAGADALLRAVPGAAGAIAGAGAAAAERPLPNYPGINRAEADRLQRDLTIIGQGALAEPTMGLAAARPLAADQALAKQARTYVRPPEPPPPSPPIAHAPGPAQGQFRFPDETLTSHGYGDAYGGRQPELPGMESQPPPLPGKQPLLPGERELQLPLEKPPVIDAEGQYGFSIDAPDPRNVSRQAMPPTSGVASEMAPPPRRRGEPEQQPHSLIGQGLAAQAEGVQPQRPAGINVMQPGQVDATLAHSLSTQTKSPPGGPPRTPPPEPPPPRPPAPPIERRGVQNPDWQGAPAPIPRDQQVMVRPPDSTQGMLQEPPVRPGTVRLYAADPRAPRAFTTDRATAEQAGPLRHVDVPHGQLAAQFRPGREPNSFVAHRIWEAPAYQRQVRPTRQMPTQPTQRQWPRPPGEPPPPLAPPPARGGPGPAGQPPGGPRMAGPRLDAAVARAVGAPSGNVPQSPGAPRRPGSAPIVIRPAAPPAPVARGQNEYSGKQINQLLNRKQLLNTEAARRGMPPNALKAELVALDKANRAADDAASQKRADDAGLQRDPPWAQPDQPAPLPAPKVEASVQRARKAADKINAREAAREPPKDDEPYVPGQATKEFNEREAVIEGWAEEGGAKGSRNAKASEYVYLRDKLEKEGELTDKEKLRRNKLYSDLSDAHEAAQKPAEVDHAALAQARHEAAGKLQEEARAIPEYKTKGKGKNIGEMFPEEFDEFSSKNPTHPGIEKRYEREDTPGTWEQRVRDAYDERKHDLAAMVAARAEPQFKEYHDLQAKPNKTRAEFDRLNRLHDQISARADEIANEKPVAKSRKAKAEPAAEPPAAVAAKAVRPKKAAAAEGPKSLHQHIKSLGGIKNDDKGEVAGIFGDRKSGHFLQLVRKNGLPLDRIVENVARGAPEERYLHEGADINDLKRALGENGGKDHYPAGEEGHVPKAKQDRIADENAAHADRVADIEKKVDEFIADPDLDLVDFQEGMRQRMYDIMEEGKFKNPVDAYEQAVKEHNAQREFEGDVGPPKEIKPAAEKGADNKPQEVMFAKDEKVAAQRAADAPLKPKTAQKGSDFGMFADRQDDLMDLVNKPAAAKPAAAKPVGDEAQMKAAGDKFSSELHKAEQAAEKAGKSKDDYINFLSDEGKTALKEHDRLAEIVDEAKFGENYKKLNDMLPEGYTATREKYIRLSGDEAWADIAGERHDRVFEIRDKNGEQVGNISGVHLFDKDTKGGWFKELLDTGNAKPVHEKAMAAAREAGGKPKGVVDLGFEKAKPDLQKAADELGAAGRKTPGEVKSFPKKADSEINRLQQKYFDAQRQLDSLEKDVKRGVLEETDPKYLNARRAAEDAINAWHEAEGISLKKPSLVDKIKDLGKDEKGGGRIPTNAEIRDTIKKFFGDERGGGKPPTGGAPTPPAPSQTTVATHLGTTFKGANLAEAAAFAKAAGFKPHQIFMTNGQLYNKSAATTVPPGGGGRPPGGAGTPPAGGTPQPPRGPASSVEAARKSILDQVADKPKWYSKLPTTKAEAKQLWRDFYTSTKNAMDPIEQLRKLKPGTLSPEEDFAMLARLTKGMGGRFQQIMKHGTYDIETGKVNGKGLDEVIKPIANDPDGFTAYALAKRAIELDSRGIKTGIDAANARMVVAADAAKFEPVFRDLHAFQDRVLQNLVKSGVLSDAAATKMRQLNKEYVPFYRMLDPNSELGQQLGAGLQTRNPVFRIKGSDKDIHDPVNSIIKNTYLFTDLAERNRTLVQMKKFNDGLPADKQFMVRDRSSHPIEVQPQEIQKFMDKHGIEGFADDSMTIFRPNAFTPAADKIRLYNKGKAEVYTVPENVGKAINAMDRETQGLFLKIMATPAKLLRAGAIFSPEFIARNPLRDLVGAFIQSKHGSIPVYDFAVGLKHIFKKSNDFQEWQIAGGGNANLVSMDRAMLHTDPYTVKGVANKVVNPLQWYRMLQDLSELSENATRMGMYTRARGKGIHPLEAAFEAREGTLDFARMGASPTMRALNSMIPFFNAQIEGVDRAARAFRDNPLGTTAKVTAAVTLPSVLLWFKNKDDERVKELPAWQKDLFWIVPGSDKWVPVTGDDAAKWAGKDLSKLTNTVRQGAGGLERNNATIWRIPKPFEIGVAFGSVPERMLDAYYAQKPDAFKNLGKTMVDALTPSVVPQAVLPGVEQFANRSIFLDRSLLTEEQKKLPPAQQYGPYTSETSKLLGNVIRSVAGDKTSFGSPIMIDNYLRQWTGGLGKHVVDAIDTAVKSQQTRPPEPAKGLADMPGIKAFVARFPSQSAQSIQDFYDTRTERKTEAAGIKAQQKTDPKGASERRGKADTWTGEPFAKMLKADRDAVKRIAADKNMSPDDKRAAMDLTYLLMIEHAKGGVAAFERNKRRPPDATR